MLTKCGNGITTGAEQQAVLENLQHRIRHAWVGGVFKGDIHCVSVYLHDTAGASEANMKILLEVAALLKRFRSSL